MKPALTRRNPNQKRAIETKQKLLSTALEMLKRDGLSKLTTRRLAKETDISIGVIYDYFPSKQALIFWIYKQRLKRQMRIFDKTLLGDNLNRPITETYPAYINTMIRERMWSRLDTELRLAEDDDANLAALIKEFKNELTGRYCTFLKAQGVSWPDEDLINLAEFSQAIDLTGMKLQLHSETKQSRSFFSNMTGRTSVFLLHESGAITTEEREIIYDKLDLHRIPPMPVG